jgi:hypothetical protein
LRQSENFRRNQDPARVQPLTGIDDQVANLPSRDIEVEILHFTDITIRGPKRLAFDLFKSSQHF